MADDYAWNFILIFIFKEFYVALEGACESYLNKNAQPNIQKGQTVIYFRRRRLDGSDFTTELIVNTKLDKEDRFINFNVERICDRITIDFADVP